MNLNKATLISKGTLTTDVIELKFHTTDPDNFINNFKAGKFVSIKIPGEKITFRSYSVSGITDNGDFELCVKVVEGGVGSNFLKNLAENSEIEFLGPNGHFTFNSQTDKKIILVATGTGLAPMKAFLEEQLIKCNNKQTFKLIFGVRYIKDIFYKNLFESLIEKYPNFTYAIAVSRPEDSSFTGTNGRVTDVLRVEEIDPGSTEVYICGLKEMVDEVHQIMIEKGVSEEAVHFERFN